MKWLWGTSQLEQYTGCTLQVSSLLVKVINSFRRKTKQKKSAQLNLPCPIVLNSCSYTISTAMSNEQIFEESAVRASCAVYSTERMLKVNAIGSDLLIQNAPRWWPRSREMARVLHKDRKWTGTERNGIESSRIDWSINEARIALKPEDAEERNTARHGTARN